MAANKNHLPEWNLYGRVDKKKKKKYVFKKSAGEGKRPKDKG